MGKSCGYLGKDILGERKSRRRVWPEQSKGKVGGDGGGVRFKAPGAKSIRFVTYSE